MKKIQISHSAERITWLKNNAGFTLIELMATVAILGVLVTAALATFDAATEKQRIAACEANLDTIEIAIHRAAAIYEKPLNLIDNDDVNPFIKGGIAALQCEAHNNPQPSYSVVNGVISPAHSH